VDLRVIRGVVGMWECGLSSVSPSHILGQEANSFAACSTIMCFLTQSPRVKESWAENSKTVSPNPPFSLLSDHPRYVLLYRQLTKTTCNMVSHNIVIIPCIQIRQIRYFALCAMFVFLLVILRSWKVGTRILFP
jgi:hypothetical protein